MITIVIVIAQVICACCQINNMLQNEWHFVGKVVLVLDINV